VIGDHQIEVATFERFDKGWSSCNLPYVEIEVFLAKLAYDVSAVVLVVVDDKSAQRAVYGITSGASVSPMSRLIKQEEVLRRNILYLV
jgi:hypothetical protein